jgi:hypothetical protein
VCVCVRARECPGLIALATDQRLLLRVATAWNTAAILVATAALICCGVNADVWGMSSVGLSAGWLACKIVILLTAPRHVGWLEHEHDNKLVAAEEGSAAVASSPELDLLADDDDDEPMLTARQLRRSSREAPFALQMDRLPR